MLQLFRDGKAVKLPYATLPQNARNFADRHFEWKKSTCLSPHGGRIIRRYMRISQWAVLGVSPWVKNLKRLWLNRQHHQCKHSDVIAPRRLRASTLDAKFSVTGQAVDRPYDTRCEKSDLKTVKYARTAFDNPISSASATSA